MAGSGAVEAGAFRSGLLWRPDFSFDGQKLIELLEEISSESLERETVPIGASIAWSLSFSEAVEDLGLRSIAVAWPLPLSLLIVSAFLRSLSWC